MPQVDKVTFAPIAFWTFVIYLGGFLYLNTGSLYTFLTGLKTVVKVSFARATLSSSIRHTLGTILVFPLLSL